jgi:hypothetical protein
MLLNINWYNFSGRQYGDKFENVKEASTMIQQYYFWEFNEILRKYLNK